ncbi:MAG: hypothetical protein HFI38_02430 [Lachnospiraceae bacterium]|jgi:hypothetical protein|nr:hypothetical protein [Lachnospiraceae bacterium]
MTGLICDDLECIMAEERLISEAWSGGRQLYQYDSTAPSLTVAAPAGTAENAPSYWTSGAAYRVQGSVTDADSGAAAVYVNGKEAVVSGSSWYGDITLTADTTVAVQVYAVDKAGNRTGTITRYVRYDSMAPAVSLTAPAADSYISGTSVTVTGTASDAGGIRSLTVNGTAVAVAANGAFSISVALTANVWNTVTVAATDYAGRSTTVARRIYSDTVNPAVSFTAPAADSYTSAASVTASGTATDAAGIRSVTVNGTAVTVAANGAWSRSVSLTANAWNTITVTATDRTGRTTTVTRRVYCDMTNPTLAVSAPAGTSAGAPTYYQSDAAVSYTVSGTASDATGIRSVTVNGAAASVSGSSWSKALSLATNTTHTITVVATDGAGRTSTVVRYLRVEAWYQYAARVAGTTVQASLDATLKNSAVCNAIAGYATAYDIMKSHYSSSMASYIGSYYSAGLNLLNYRCHLKTYLFKDGADTGAVSYSISTIGSENGNWVARRENNAYLYVYVSAGMYLKMAYINFIGWNRIGIRAKRKQYDYDSIAGFMGLSTDTICDFNSDNTTFKVARVTFDAYRDPEWTYLGLSAYQGSYYLKFGSVLGFGANQPRDCYIYDVIIE